MAFYSIPFEIVVKKYEKWSCQKMQNGLVSPLSGSSITINHKIMKNLASSKNQFLDSLFKSGGTFDGWFERKRNQIKVHFMNEDYVLNSENVFGDYPLTASKPSKVLSLLGFSCVKKFENSC